MISEGRAPNWFEPLFTLAFCAARTKTMKVGTAVLIARYRDLFVLRKQAATLDQLDGGRFLVCFGLGMCQDELTALRPRLVQSHRGNVLEELIESLQLPLASGRLPVSYEGEGAASPEVRFYREPIQKPLPIYAPARTRATFGRICRLGLGLMTLAAAVPGGLEALKLQLEAHGRDVDIVAEGKIRIKRTREKAEAAYCQSLQGQARAQSGGAPARLSLRTTGSGLRTGSRTGSDRWRLRKSAISMRCIFQELHSTSG